MVRHPSRRTQTQSDDEEAKKRITANDFYELVVGEIGFPRHDFLYEIAFWEVNRIVRGYRHREITYTVISRLQSFIQAKTSLADTTKLRTPSDLWPLPWEDEDEFAPEMPITEEDAQDLVELMRNINNPHPESATQ